MLARAVAPIMVVARGNRMKLWLSGYLTNDALSTLDH